MLAAADKLERLPEKWMERMRDAHHDAGRAHTSRSRRLCPRRRSRPGSDSPRPYILGRLRGLTFFSLAECNAAIALVMRRMNERPMRNLGLSRRELFETIERDALIALPADDWEFAEWRRARVNLDYHIEVHDFLYSVPHALIRAEVDVRITARTVEIFHRGRRVGAHQRRTMGRKHGTDPDHMPSSHRRYAEWTPDRFRRWAGKIGPNTECLIVAVLASRPHPEQGFRTCLGILRSYRGLDAGRVEAISARAVELGVLNCKGVAALLARKADNAAAKSSPAAPLFDHANLRGPGYYH